VFHKGSPSELHKGCTTVTKKETMANALGIGETNIREKKEHNKSLKQFGQTNDILETVCKSFAGGYCVLTFLE